MNVWNLALKNLTVEPALPEEPQKHIRPRTIENQVAREMLGEDVMKIMQPGTEYTKEELLPNENASMAGHVMRYLIQEGKVVRRIKASKMFYKLTPQGN